jgi:hypothetical protein
MSTMTRRGGSSELTVLIACFSGRKAAGRNRRSLALALRSTGAVLLDTTVIDVDEQHAARTHNPRRVLAGTLTPLLTWGLCGLLTGGWAGAIFWGLLGALSGGLYTYFKVRLATKAQLEYLGSQLPPDSSALLVFTEARDPEAQLTAAGRLAPSVASVVSIHDDLTGTVRHWAGDARAVAHGTTEPSPAASKTLVNMILTRYPQPATARQVADKLQARMTDEVKQLKVATAAAKRAGAEALKELETNVAAEEAAGAEPEVELVIRTDRSGKRRAYDPNLGPMAVGRGDISGWAGFGVVCGVIVGWIGNGFWGSVEVGIIAGVVCGVFGFFAGMLYGLWAGRSASARRLRPVAPLLTPGTSMIFAWAGGGLGPEGLAELSTADSSQLVVRFDAVPGGLTLDTGRSG